MKTRELVYIVIDQAKKLSDDSDINEEEVLFLLERYRTYVIEQKYIKARGNVSHDNYQSICVDLEIANPKTGTLCGTTYLRSVKRIPSFMSSASAHLSVMDIMLSDNIVYVSPERIKYVGNRIYEKSLIYASVMPDGHLWLKSGNIQFSYLKRLSFDAVFSDMKEAHDMSCDTEGKPCDILDMEFPIEDSLSAPLIEAVLKSVLGTKILPKDFLNNASDDESSQQAQIPDGQANGQNN